ncbi:hypothetical protein BraRD5C2_35530 [Bradyrhizobium sp. RD5-C2]|nr:hypothetical protein BraRD5C2_35530 [Bradyrhizobium sp. RD5-C2]
MEPAASRLAASRGLPAAATPRSAVVKSGARNAKRSPEERERGWSCRHFTPGRGQPRLPPR